MIPCVWYVSGTVPPWVRPVIGNMAAALRARDVPLSLYIDGAANGSWRALTGLERAGRILLTGRGTLWHLWGTPPWWWGLVRLRSRTVHTAFREKAAWRGYPTRLFPAPAPDGEAVLLPAFDTRISQGAAGEGSPAVYPGTSSEALKSALEGRRTADPRPAAALSGVLAAGPEPADALRAAALTVQGLAVAALRSPFLDALLGPEGYFVCPEDTEEAWGRTLDEALSERGRQKAASARHFLKARCSAEQSADSLIAAYREALGG